MGTLEYCTHIEEIPMAYIAGILCAYLWPVLYIAKTAGVERWGDVPFARFD